MSKNSSSKERSGFSNAKGNGLEKEETGEMEENAEEDKKNEHNGVSMNDKEDNRNKRRNKQNDRDNTSEKFKGAIVLIDFDDISFKLKANSDNFQDAGERAGSLSVNMDKFRRVFKILRELPFYVYSGEIHYFRTFKSLYKDRLQKIKQAYCNSISTYIPWNYHMPNDPELNDMLGKDGQVPSLSRLEGLEAFLEEAVKLGFLIILRPGPFINGEWDNGGHPGWLINKGPEFFRANDPIYLKYAGVWLKAFNNFLKTFVNRVIGKFRLIFNPVLFYLIEDECSCGEHNYYGELIRYIVGSLQNGHGNNLKDQIIFITNNSSNNNIFNKYIGKLNKAVINESAKKGGGKGDNVDKSSQNMELPSGEVPTIYETLDLYPEPWSKKDFYLTLKRLRERQPDFPIFGSEVQAGWFSVFGAGSESLKNMSYKGKISPIWTSYLVRNLIINGMNGVNYYMFHGGTNPGYFTAKFVTTTYDFQAPINEYGGLNERYYSIRLIGSLVKSFNYEFANITPVEGLAEQNPFMEVTLKNRKNSNNNRGQAPNSEAENKFPNKIRIDIKAHKNGGSKYKFRNIHRKFLKNLICRARMREKSDETFEGFIFLGFFDEAKDYIRRKTMMFKGDTYVVDYYHHSIQMNKFRDESKKDKKGIIYYNKNNKSNDVVRRSFLVNSKSVQKNSKFAEFLKKRLGFLDENEDTEQNRNPQFIYIFDEDKKKYIKMDFNEGTHVNASNNVSDNVSNNASKKGVNSGANVLPNKRANNFPDDTSNIDPNLAKYEKDFQRIYFGSGFAKKRFSYEFRPYPAKYIFNFKFLSKELSSFAEVPLYNKQAKLLPYNIALIPKLLSDWHIHSAIHNFCNLSFATSEPYLRLIHNSDNLKSVLILFHDRIGFETNVYLSLINPTSRIINSDDIEIVICSDDGVPLPESLEMVDGNIMPDSPLAFVHLKRMVIPKDLFITVVMHIKESRKENKQRSAVPEYNQDKKDAQEPRYNRKAKSMGSLETPINSQYPEYKVIVGFISDERAAKTYVAEYKNDHLEFMKVTNVSPNTNRNEGKNYNARQEYSIHEDLMGISFANISIPIISDVKFIRTQKIGAEIISQRSESEDTHSIDPNIDGISVPIKLFNQILGLKYLEMECELENKLHKMTIPIGHLLSRDSLNAFYNNIRNRNNSVNDPNTRNNDNFNENNNNTDRNNNIDQNNNNIAHNNSAHNKNNSNNNDRNKNNNGENKEVLYRAHELVDIYELDVINEDRRVDYKKIGRQGFNAMQVKFGYKQECGLINLEFKPNWDILNNEEFIIQEINPDIVSERETDYSIGDNNIDNYHNNDNRNNDNRNNDNRNKSNISLKENSNFQDEYAELLKLFFQNGYALIDNWQMALEPIQKLFDIEDWSPNNLLNIEWRDCYPFNGFEYHGKFDPGYCVYRGYFKLDKSYLSDVKKDSSLELWITIPYVSDMCWVYVNGQCLGGILKSGSLLLDKSLINKEDTFRILIYVESVGRLNKGFYEKTGLLTPIFLDKAPKKRLKRFEFEKLNRNFQNWSRQYKMELWPGIKGLVPYRPDLEKIHVYEWMLFARDIEDRIKYKNYLRLVSENYDFNPKSPKYIEEDGDFWDKIILINSKQLGIMNLFEDKFLLAVYRTEPKIFIPEYWIGSRIAIEFQKVSGRYFLYVNGKLAENGSGARYIDWERNLLIEPLSIDITDLIKFGEENVIAIMFISREKEVGVSGEVFITRHDYSLGHSDDLEINWKYIDTTLGEKLGFHKVPKIMKKTVLTHVKKRERADKEPPDKMESLNKDPDISQSDKNKDKDNLTPNSKSKRINDNNSKSKDHKDKIPYFLDLYNNFEKLIDLKEIDTRLNNEFAVELYNYSSKGYQDFIWLKIGFKYNSLVLSKDSNQLILPKSSQHFNYYKYFIPIGLTLPFDYGKTNIYLNGHLIGRYWDVEPQMTFYLPEEYLKELNVLTLFINTSNYKVKFNRRIFIKPYEILKKVKIKLKFN
ncbi:MAG: beta-galactosidase [Promethearchaeota archaeon]